MRDDEVRGVRGSEAKSMFRAEARWSSSRAVITQSVSLIPPSLSAGDEVEDIQDEEVSSERLASSFLSKQGIRARCQTLEGGMP